MQINEYFISKAIQGIYTIDPIYDLSVGILWKPAKKWDIHLNSEDLLKERRQEVRVDEGGQYYKLNMDNDTRFVSLSVKYTFGAFKTPRARLRRGHPPPGGRRAHAPAHPGLRRAHQVKNKKPLTEKLKVLNTKSQNINSAPTCDQQNLHF